MSDDPWYAIDEWQPPSVRQLPVDAQLLEQLHLWVRGGRILAGLAHVTRSDVAGALEDGYLSITYSDEFRPFISVHARQAFTEYQVGTSGGSSFTAALEDCLGMAADYEREELLYLAVPGLA